MLGAQDINNDIKITAFSSCNVGLIMLISNPELGTLSKWVRDVSVKISKVHKKSLIMSMKQTRTWICESLGYERNK